MFNNPFTCYFKCTNVCFYYFFFKYFIFYFRNNYRVYLSRTDKTQETISRTVSTSRLNAAKHFAERKQLPLREFLKIFAVKCLI
jgi:hypothetical protein